MTPFGAAVEPDVYCKRASESGSNGGSRQRRATAGSSRSVATRRAARSAGTNGAMRLSARTTRGPPSATTLASSSRLWASRSGRGGYAGTGTTPAYWQPKNAETNASPGA